MAEPLTVVQQRQQEGWFVGHAPSHFWGLFETYCDRLSNYVVPPRILLAEQEPSCFLAAFLAACCHTSTVALANPDWGTTEWQQAIAQLQPDLLWRDANETCLDPSSQSDHPLDNGLILIPTGGTSGQLRFATHTWETLMASVKGFQAFFEVAAVNSCCVLPLYHVSGLMQFLRSFASGGRLVVLPFRQLEGGRLQVNGLHSTCAIAPTDFFISLVPTQLERLLAAQQAAWLAQFRTVLLGGAPAWSSLLETAQQHQIPLAPTYGMTETASQVATLKPADFLQGKTGYQILPHAQVQLVADTVVIHASSLMQGYYQGETISQWVTDDIGYFDRAGYLHILGRSSDKIITGGENVFPAEVEAVIWATDMVQDVAVIGLDDEHWGQVVTAVYVPMRSPVTYQEMKPLLQPQLSSFKVPKQWIAVAALPRNAQGKLNRTNVRSLALTSLIPGTFDTIAASPPTAVAASVGLGECTRAESTPDSQAYLADRRTERISPETLSH